MKSVLQSSTILIVADSANQPHLLQDYLRGFGLNILVAHTGNDGITLAREAQPDIILLDTVLPGLSGFDTCSHLKDHEATRRIPIIFMMGSGSTVDKVRGLTLGAVDFITKPIHFEELIARLKTHLTIQKLQNELEDKNQTLLEEITQREELIAELDAFAHTVAHDLKNPIGVTMTHAQFLDKYGKKLSEEDFQKYAGTIVQNGKKMVNIIDELLLLASVRTEKIAPKPLNMAEIVEETEERLSYLIAENQVDFVTPPEWPIAWGHAPWVEEIWVNYCSNAIKYGGQPPKVELGATIQTDDCIKFWVRDNGMGLTPEARETLFIPFTRLNQVEIDGHGLGLSIVQRIVDKLGGRVGVESDGIPGKGSIFSFYLPLYDATPFPREN
ncbi:MAG: hybrid sensor histidine kinase/response regulator [Anaerolineae bacterium]|nr:hybrid sensor histidine kinase/response regulator [Anaerolineae bacterium]